MSWLTCRTWVELGRVSNTAFGRRTLLGSLAGTLLVTPGVSRQRKILYTVDAFGARGDGVTDDTKAIQRAVDTCARDGGGVVGLLPGGRYLSSTIVLKDHITFDIAEGATLLASDVREAYREHGCLLFAENAENIAVTGRGTIEGQGSSKAWFPTLVEGTYTVPAPFLGYWNPLEQFPGIYSPTGRPRMVLLVGCHRVELTGFRINVAPTWTVHLIGCEDLIIHGITIDNSLIVPNCDGIDIDRCRRVRVSDCAIRAGDDCIVLKTSRNTAKFGDCEDVTIANCTLESSSAGIKIEPEGAGVIRSIVATGCTISRSNRGVALLQRDGALVEDLTFSNCTITTRRHHSMWWGAAEALHVSNLPRRSSMPAGTVRSIRFENIICRGEGGLFVRGWPGSRTEDISFSSVDVTMEKTTQYPADTYDIRPTELTNGLIESTISAIYARDAAELIFRDVQVRWSGSALSSFGAALHAEQIAGLTLDHITGEAAHASQRAIELLAVSRSAAVSN